MLKFDNITKKYRKKIALSSVSLDLREGVYALLGPNGAGKTTLMKIVAGIIKPTEGKVLFEGQDIVRLGMDYRAKIGYLPQNSDFYENYTGKDVIQYFAALKGIRLYEGDTERILEKVHLSEDANRKCGGYSGGMKRRLGIAVALMGDPKILIFDEPTAGLDPKERAFFKDVVAQLGKEKIIIYATHIISDVEEISDKIIMIKNGTVLDCQSIDQFIRQINENDGKAGISGATVNSLEDVYLYYFGE